MPPSSTTQRRPLLQRLVVVLLGAGFLLFCHRYVATANVSNGGLGGTSPSSGAWPPSAGAFSHHQRAGALATASDVLALYEDPERAAQVSHAKLDPLLRVSMLESPPLEFTIAKVWGQPYSVERREPQCNPKLSRRKIHLIIGVPNIDRAIEHMGAFVPVESHSDALEHGFNAALGVVHRAAESELCGLCSVTVVRPSELTAVDDFDHDANMSSNVYETDPTLMQPLVDPKLCGGRTKRTMQYWRMKASTAGLADWHAGVLRATDKVVEDEANKEAVVAFLDAGFPPEAAFDEWLARLAHRGASATQVGKPIVAACPHSQNWGDEILRSVTTDREVAWNNFGFEPAIDESTSTVKLLPRLAGVSLRFPTPIEQPTLYFSSACFATRLPNWIAAAKHRNLTHAVSVAADSQGSTAAQRRVAAMALSVSALNGYAHQTVTTRKELLSGIDAALHAMHCDQMLPRSGDVEAAKKAADVLSENTRFCMEARALRERGEGLAQQVKVVEDIATRVVIEGRDVAAYAKTGKMRPISEVMMRAPAPEIFEQLARLPEGFSCFYRDRGVTKLCGPAFRQKRLLHLYPADDEHDPEARFALAANAGFERGAFSEVARAFASIVQVIDQQVDAGSLPVKCRGCPASCSAGPAAADVADALQLCRQTRALVVEKVLTPGLRFVEHGTAAIAKVMDTVRDVTVLHPFAAPLNTWTEQSVAFLLAGLQPIVVKNCQTMQRLGPFHAFPEPRLFYGHRNPHHPVFQADFAQSRSFTAGALAKASGQHLLGALVSTSYATTGAMLQWNTPCGCSERTRFAHLNTAAARTVVRTRASMSPVCNCERKLTKWDSHRAYTTLLETYSPMYGLVGEIPGSIALHGLHDRPSITDLGRPRVVDIAVHDLDPRSPRDTLTCTKCNIDFKVLRVSCSYSHVPEYIVQLAEQYDEVWASSAACRAALVASDVTASMVHVQPHMLEPWPVVGVETRAARRRLIDGKAGGGKPEDPLENFLFVAMFTFDSTADWRALFGGYFATFSAAHNVTLFVKVKVGKIGIPGHVAPEDAGFVRDRVLELATSLGYSDHTQLPHFVVQAGYYPEHDIRALYELADTFIAVTRGVPFHESLVAALSAGVYTIATACLGDQEYVTPTTADVLATTQVPIPLKIADALGIAGEKATWCETSADDVRTALLRAVAAPVHERKEKGRRAVEELQQMSKSNRDRLASRVVDIERHVRAGWYAGIIGNLTVA